MANRRSRIAAPVTRFIKPSGKVAVVAALNPSSYGRRSGGVEVPRLAQRVPRALRRLGHHPAGVPQLCLRDVRPEELGPVAAAALAVVAPERLRDLPRV